MAVNLKSLFVLADTPIREVIASIDRNGKGIALVVDRNHHLIDTVTDGDIRRAILVNMDTGLPIQKLLEWKASVSPATPITAPVGTPDTKLLHMMNQYTVRHIPLLNKNEQVVDMALLSDLTKEFEAPLQALVMAGGYGTRLRPLTEELPKPMLPVGDRPLLELIIEQLRQAGIHKVNLATHHKGEVIAKHFKNGQGFGVDIHYVEESQPLGTAGALGMLDEIDEPLLVINGDILSQVDFRAMRIFHKEHRAELTMGVRRYEWKVPYGVVECEGERVRCLSEKRASHLFVNAGIYLLEPSVRSVIQKGERCDMTDVIQRLLSQERRVVSFPIREYWLDIGHPTDYEQALTDAKNGKFGSDATENMKQGATK